MQGVTRGYKWLQGVTTEGYKGLRVVAKMPIMCVFESDVFVVQKCFFPI